MKSPSGRRVSLILSLTLLTILAAPLPSLAQEGNSNESAPQQTTPPNSRVRGDFDLEMRLHLLIGTAKPADASRLPESLEPAVRQVRSTLQFPNYRLGGVFMNRVKNGRSLEVRGEAGALPLMLISTANLNRYTPIYYHFSMNPVEVRTDETGREVVSIQNFRFGMRVPVVTALATPAPNGSGPSVPSPVVYEDIGIGTGLTIPEGQPVVVGTLYTGQEGDVIIVVLTANRVNRR